MKDICNVCSDCCVLIKRFHLCDVVRWALFLSPPSEPRRRRQEAITLSEFPLLGGGTSRQPQTVSGDHVPTPYWRVSLTLMSSCSSPEHLLCVPKCFLGVSTSLSSKCFTFYTTQAVTGALVPPRTPHGSVLENDITIQGVKAQRFWALSSAHHFPYLSTAVLHILSVLL